MIHYIFKHQYIGLSPFLFCCMNELQDLVIRYNALILVDHMQKPVSQALSVRLENATPLILPSNEAYMNLKKTI